MATQTDTQEPASPAEAVIAKFGGLTGTATALGYPVTTVQGWKDRGQIPQKHWPSLMSLAADAGIDLEVTDFLRTSPAPSKGEA